MNSFERFSEKKLPDEKCFYGPLKDRTTDNNGKKLNGHITDQKYLTCNKIWNQFNMKNIGDYHHQNFKKDVLLLADIFEKFIDTCLTFSKIDPCHHLSFPGLSWDAMLKMLEKISDIDLYLFIEKELRGGICCNCKKYNEANHK